MFKHISYQTQNILLGMNSVCENFVLVKMALFTLSVFQLHAFILSIFSLVLEEAIASTGSWYSESQ